MLGNNLADPRLQGYGQQPTNAGFPLGSLAGALQGGMQGTLPGVRGGLAGLQATSTTPQQVAQGRFTAQALQNNLQQLGQYQARQGALANASLANGVLANNAAVAAAAAAGARAGGLAGGLGGLSMNNPQLTAIRPAVDRTNIGLANLGAAGVNQQGLGLQGYTQQSLAAALGGQQATLNLQGMNRLAAAGVGLQNNLLLQGRQGLGANTVNLLQPGGMAGANANARPSQDLLSLLSRSQQQKQAGGPGLGTGTVGNDPYAVLRKVGGAGGDGFSMTNEDFPALPGPAPRQGDDGARGGFLGGLQSGVGRGGFPMLSGGDQFGGDMARAQAAASLPQQHNLSEYEQLLRIQQARLGAGGGGGVTSAAMSPGGPGKQGGGLGLGLGGVVIGAGPGGGDGSQLMGAVTPQDRFGLLGLMPLLKMSDPNLTMLALGTDLTSLGLNLNSSDNLHKSLVSPLSDTPVKAEPEYELPACYKHTPQRLQPGYLAKFKEETLFYIFYSMPADEAQLVAADELSARGWLFHKVLRMWMLPAPSTTPQRTARGERGSFLVFNPSAWEVEQKSDLEIASEDIEVAPRLPRPKQLQQQQQGGQQQQQQGGQGGPGQGGHQGAPGAQAPPSGTQQQQQQQAPHQQQAVPLRH